VGTADKITELAADTLRAWALDEDLKRRVMATPALARLATAIAGRYSAGETADDAITAAQAGLARGQTAAFLALAGRLITAGHPVTLATHDEALVDALIAAHGDALRQPGVEFEMLMGLGTGLLDRLHGQGFRTREYVIFGGEWWLYALNRLAEQPERVLAALADINHLILNHA
jgi:proline dehydrogenase